MSQDGTCGAVAMDTGSEPAYQPLPEDLLLQLKVLHAVVASFQERVDTSIESIETFLVSVEEKLRKIKDVATIRLDGTESNKQTHRIFVGIRVPNTAEAVIPPTIIIDKITTAENYVPAQAAEVMNRFDFQDRILMSSATIERHEQYHDVYTRLLEVEKGIMQRVQTYGSSAVNSSSTQFVSEVKGWILKDPEIEALQSQLLELRIRRYRLTTIVEKFLNNQRKKDDSPNHNQVNPPSSSSPYHSVDTNKQDPDSHDGTIGNKGVTTAVNPPA